MITLPEALQKFMQQQDLTGLKPYALLYRNKWVEEESGSGDTGHYELETTPIDITDMIVKPNTLSMTLDVNEVAQYNCNNVTLTLADTKNRFIEGTQNSLFPDGYQIYGSKVVLYYGIEQQDYVIENGKLLWANPNLYLQNTANSYIDTGILADSNTQAILEYKIDDFKTIASGTRNFIISGSAAYQQMANFYANFWAQGSPASARYWLNTSDKGAATTAGSAFTDTTAKYKLTLNGTNINTKSYVVKDDGTTYSYTNTAGTITQDKNILIFNRGSGPASTYSFLGKIYNCIINKNGITVRHFVPVPVGLQIGDFTVPSNGFWDLVTQSFFGNVGDNSFSIGNDNPVEKYQRTPLFTGSIKELPTHKPEQYQVELKLVSPLEMLKDIEAKNFSDKVIGETLTYIETDSDGHRIYNTTGTGVGGFDAVYADGIKLFEGVDYEVDQLNEYGKVAVVTIINSDYYALTITADYYTWKTGLTVEQIIAGLVGLAGYDSTKEDIKNVVWQTSVRNPPINTPVFAALGYYEDSTYDYKFNWQSTYGNKWSQTTPGSRTNILPSNFDFNFELYLDIELGSYWVANFRGSTSICLGDEYNGNTLNVTPAEGRADVSAGVNGVNNGISVRIVAGRVYNTNVLFNRLFVHQIVNGTATLLYVYDYETSTTEARSGKLKISRRGSTVTVYMDTTQVASCTINGSLDYMYQGGYNDAHTEKFYCYNQAWDFYDNNLSLYASAQSPCWISAVCDKTNAGVSWGAISANLSGVSTNYSLSVRFSDDSITWSNPQSYNLNTTIGASERYLYYIIGVDNNPNDSFDINEPTTWYLAGSLLVNLVDLSGKTVLEALQDFALISGYEFGVDRNGVFFFKPRIASTTPIYVLDHSELTKVDTVKRNFSDFFTKLTLTFAQRPLEFYANTGYRPTPVDKYGIINKEIDKPEIVNYDNPELAQAIGPQLLQVYSQLSNIIQATGKLNLSLELGDIVSLRRNMNLVEPNDAQEFVKYINSSIYYRACKITGMNYNFAKRQITYTLRDVTSDNNLPPIDAYSFPYELPIPLGKLIED